ncbi:hypothetical protein [Streptomyces sp. H27-D2]|uniref:hypothetical protein n=1 Tax=Streptomyces sp. H27-D2 TaxID=3046304 RepID=UPI002DBE1FCB|nr:hypothetical protein [Streptomyces sp. H27-D2]MEC4017793.1 hypothetical protein [Streptomyces sp. H27-D2]
MPIARSETNDARLQNSADQPTGHGKHRGSTSSKEAPDLANGGRHRRDEPAADR